MIIMMAIRDRSRKKMESIHINRVTNLLKMTGIWNKSQINVSKLYIEQTNKPSLAIRK